MGTFYLLWGVITFLIFLVYLNTDSENKKISLAYFEYDGELPDEIPSI